MKTLFDRIKLQRWTALVWLATMAVGNPATATKSRTVQLETAGWRVQIDPQTMETIGFIPNGNRLIVSLPQEGLGEVTDLTMEADRAEWGWSGSDRRVTARLTAEGLSLVFSADEPGTLTWPALGTDPDLRAYILPLAEGLYAPAAESVWQDFLIEESPISVMERLSMPFWALHYQGWTLTYILTNPFDSDLVFRREGNTFVSRLTHQFQPIDPTRKFGVLVKLGSDSPIEPARAFRTWIQQNASFVTLREKAVALDEVNKLLGAPHAYLWAVSLLGEDDVSNWKEFTGQLVAASQSAATSGAIRVWSLLSPDVRSAVLDEFRQGFVSPFVRRSVLRGLTELLKRPELYDSSVWPSQSLPRRAREMIARGTDSLPVADLVRLNGQLLEQAFPGLLASSSSWGAGISPKMIHELQAAGFDRLWLGLPDLDIVEALPQTVVAAREAGYLIAPYDSFHSIHHPGEKDTWPTAQFDAELYAKGGIVNANGTMNKGFRGKGYHLSSIAAQPYVVRRVTDVAARLPFNSWFVDCDATGELFDNYAARFRASKEDDMELRLERMAWIRDQFKMVVGSEVGAWFAAPVIHFGHGMTTPVFGWGDPLLHNRESPYFLGKYYPPDSPPVMMKPTVLPDKYREIFFDPSCRLPLYQTAFHDSVITTHHWGAGSLKFANVSEINEILELLYGVPPLYHLNLQELARTSQLLEHHYRFFSPLHRALGFMPLTDFQWVTSDRMVQQTVFGDEIEMVANFRDSSYQHSGSRIPAGSILARWRSSGKTLVYTPEQASSHVGRSSAKGEGNPAGLSPKPGKARFDGLKHGERTGEC